MHQKGESLGESMSDKPNCFGTTQFQKGSWICKGCDYYEECKKVAPDRPPNTKRYRKWERFLNETSSTL